MRQNRKRTARINKKKMEKQGVCHTCQEFKVVSEDDHCRDCTAMAKVATCKIRSPACAKTGQWNFYPEHPEYGEKPNNFKFFCEKCLATLSCKVCSVNIELIICTRCIQNGVYCYECAKVAQPVPSKWYCPECVCKQSTCKIVATANCTNHTCRKHCIGSSCKVHAKNHHEDDKLSLADTTVNLMKTKKRLKSLDEDRAVTLKQLEISKGNFYEIASKRMSLEECDRALKKALIAERQINALPDLEKKLLDDKAKWEQEQEEIYRKLNTESE